MITRAQAQGGNTTRGETKTRRASAAHSGARPFCMQSQSWDPASLTCSSVKRVVALTTATFTAAICCLLTPYTISIGKRTSATPLTSTPFRNSFATHAHFFLGLGYFCNPTENQEIHAQSATTRTSRFGGQTDDYYPIG